MELREKSWRKSYWSQMKRNAVAKLVPAISTSVLPESCIANFLLRLNRFTNRTLPSQRYINQKIHTIQTK